MMRDKKSKRIIQYFFNHVVFNKYRGCPQKTTTSENIYIYLDMKNKLYIYLINLVGKI